MNINEKILPWFGGKSRIEITGVKNGTKQKYRLFKRGDVVFFFRKGSSKFGCRLDQENLSEVYPIQHREKSPDLQWVKGWEKVKDKLLKSGIWPEIVDEINIALDIGHEKMNLAYDQYWKIQETEAQTQAMKQIDPRFVKINDEGKEYVTSHLLWTYAKMPKVKKMYFGKYRNQHCLAQIAAAMKEKKELHLGERANYDVSFEYNPEKNKAWYAEEYKNCGNGHYWIALNETHALFGEDD